MLLQDQVAMVTGGGKGIGKAIALRFAREGADIAIVDVNRKTAESTGREVRDLGRRATINVADVSDPDAVQSAVNDVIAELEKLDVLVNNAGIEKRAGFLEITPADWRRQLDVNLSGTFYCIQAAAREMAKRSYGRIVNLSSVAGLIARLISRPMAQRRQASSDSPGRPPWILRTTGSPSMPSRLVRLKLI